MAEQALALREYPQIIELLSILEQNGLRKEKDEVQSLVIYIGDMEDKLAQMMGELREMQFGCLRKRGALHSCRRSTL